MQHSARASLLSGTWQVYHQTPRQLAVMLTASLDWAATTIAGALVEPEQVPATALIATRFATGLRRMRCFLVVRAGTSLRRNLDKMGLSGT
jgi:hypothetical protein